MPQDRGAQLVHKAYKKTHYMNTRRPSTYRGIQNDPAPARKHPYKDEWRNSHIARTLFSNFMDSRRRQFLDVFMEETPPPRPPRVTQRFFDEETSFTFRGNYTLSDLASDFCGFYHETNVYADAEVKRADIIPGQLIAIRISRRMTFGGRGNALLLLYRTGDKTGEAALCLFRSSESWFWERPLDEIRKQVRTFFSLNRDLTRPQSQIQQSYHGSREEEAEPEYTEPTEQPPEEEPTPLKTCNNCGATITRDDSNYCWHCGTKLPTHRTGTPTSKPHPEETRNKPNCAICKKPLDEGQLLAWCPQCGAPAHRVHMLEWLHVKENCPACGKHIDEQEIQEQLTQVHTKQPPPTPKPKQETKTPRKLTPPGKTPNKQKIKTTQPTKQKPTPTRTQATTSKTETSKRIKVKQTQ